MTEAPMLAIVVTSIAAPTSSMLRLAEGALPAGVRVICVGDVGSPNDYYIPGVEFLSLAEQLQGPFVLGSALPTAHYSRKNLGYLQAISQGASWIAETDDDNSPLAAFWKAREPVVQGRYLQEPGWQNPFRFFTEATIWPRGLPLERVLETTCGTVPQTEPTERYCPIQQGLVNGDTDVDAVYRMTRGELIQFDEREPIILGRGVWSPFNSQCTFWWEDTFDLLYLPSYCSFRMTDIWRSFVAQVCLWTCGWNLALTGPMMVQTRNPHHLLSDFRGELPGYLYNGRLIGLLSALNCDAGPAYLRQNIIKCYEVFIGLGLVDTKERELLELWFSALDQARAIRTA